MAGPGPSPNAVIGHFLLLEKLGAGGLGEVWKARDETLSRIVALKFVTSGGRELLKEARAASALNHPNIVTVFEVGESEHGVYMAMELVAGETLRARLNRDRLSPAEIHDLAAQIAEGLGVAHGSGIVHRDLKPENIMIRADGYVKLLDFGLAKRLPWADAPAAGSMTASVGTATGQLAGTFSYMSPEQARGLDVDAASDVFSFGIILYEMLAGKHPFRADNVMDTLHNIISAEPPALAESPSMSGVVQRALAKDRTRRFADARILAEVLQTIAGGSPVGVEVIPEPTPKPEPRESHFIPSPRWMQASGALLGAALLVLAFVPDLSFPASASAPATPKVQSVAVLTFQAPPGNPGLQSLGQDLSEDLSTLLLKSGMQVAAQSAVQELGPSPTAREAASRLKVDAVFLGSLRVSGSQTKIRVELVNGANGFQLWSDTIAEDSKAAGLDQKVAEDIVTRVRAALSAKK